MAGFIGVMREAAFFRLRCASSAPLESPVGWRVFFRAHRAAASSESDDVEGTPPLFRCKLDSREDSSTTGHPNGSPLVRLAGAPTKDQVVALDAAIHVAGPCVARSSKHAPLAPMRRPAFVFAGLRVTPSLRVLLPPYPPATLRPTHTPQSATGSKSGQSFRRSLPRVPPTGEGQGRLRHDGFHLTTRRRRQQFARDCATRSRQEPAARRHHSQLRRRM
jgi:hypothetical protein